jgi:phosphonate transport system substrate-binding protein
MGCSSGDADSIELDFTRVQQDTQPESSARPLRVAVAGMTGPQQTYAYYSDLIGYIGEQVDRPIEIVQRPTYAAVNDLLFRNEVDLAFLCSGGYVNAASEGAADLLVVPVIDGKTTYQSYLIVPKSSEDTCLQDLRGKRFVFTDSLSHTGYRYPAYLIQGLGSTTRRFFARTFPSWRWHAEWPMGPVSTG